MHHDDFAISVTTEWNGWRSMKLRLADLCDVHWHQPAGAPWPMLHAHVSCAALAGAPAHDCDPASAPHQIRVCVLRSHNVPSAYAEVMRRATPTTLTPGAPHVAPARARV